MHLPRPIALWLTLGFVAFLFRRDFQQKPRVTSALWIPLGWLFLNGTRFVSEWLNIFGIHVGGSSLEEGSPVDAAFFFGLIAAGLYVLRKRQIGLSELVRRNMWLAIFFLYCLAAIVWSDFPFVALKRWIKILGHPIMVLVLLTEPDPEEAVTTLLKRFAYIVIPVSVCFIKYFPELGRQFSEWTGEAMNSGITMGKNALGYDLLIIGLFLFWYTLKTWRRPKSKSRRDELIFCGLFCYMTWWLVQMANSSTALMCLIIGILVMIFVGFRFIDKRLIGTYVLIGITTFLVMEVGFGLFTVVAELLGRDATLTGRTELWKDVLDVPINPLFGAGFESFWLGERLENLWALHWWRPNQAHNGYIETYLNLGGIGVFLLICLIIASFWKVRTGLQVDFRFNRLLLGFLAAIVIYNWTEAAFKSLHPVFFIFYIVSLDYPTPMHSPVFSEDVTDHAEEELVGIAEQNV